MRNILFTLALAFISVATFAQREMGDAPKLVVGIMVDQMRWDYLTRYNDRYGDGGFKRLMSEGYNCNRLLINYIPAVTAVGHASVYTGTVPAFNGIVSNSMRINGRWVTSVQDDNVQPIGTKSKYGKCSPNRLLSTTMTDELRLATNFRSKVISVALKDRASILPGGHCANAAYWADNDDSGFITSSYYMEDLPEWVKAFNKRNLKKQYMNLLTKKKDKEGYWDLLYPEETYVQSTKKNERYFFSVGNTVRQSPYGNTFTTEMAKAAIVGENLGNNPAGVPDFLAISFSSTDMIGHKLGPNSIWIEDVYLRLDKDIEGILNLLDEKVGKGNYVVWLSADHAGAHNVEFRRDNKVPADIFPHNIYLPELNTALKAKFNAKSKLVASFQSNVLYFNNDSIEAARPAGVDSIAFRKQVVDYTLGWLNAKKEVAYAFEFRNIPDYVPEPVRSMAVNGYNPKRSGDIQIVLEAGVTEDYDAGYKKDWDGISRGTQHAVWSPYDTHIPFVVMGKNVRHAWDNNSYKIVDIAATICALLNIQQPSACTGNAIPVELAE